MSQVTEAMIEAGAACIGGGSTFDHEERREMAEEIYLTMSSASPPVEQSEDCGCLSDHVEGCPMGPNYDPGFEWSPPPVTVSVEEVADTVMRAVADPGKFVPGYGSDYPSLTHWKHAAVLAALKEGHVRGAGR